MIPRMIGKLGKHSPLPGRKSLYLSNYLNRAELPVIPPAKKWSEAVKISWGNMGNDKLGDCTEAGMGHAVMVWSANSTGSTVVIPDDEIIRAYSEVSGYDPTTGYDDNGASEVDVLNQWRSGVNGHKIAAWADINPKNHDHVKEAIYLMGGLYIGIALPNISETQINNGKPWTAPDDLSGDAAPGSLGGHAVWVPDYDEDGLYAVTWGMLQQLTWSFWDAYVDEVHAIISSQDWVDKQSLAPNGLFLNALISDMRLL